jgi:uncharacterized membrane protein
MDEPSKEAPTTIKAFGWGMVVVIVCAFALGALVGNKTAHSSKAPPACLAAVNWAEDIAAGRANAESLRQFEDQAAKCRAS